MVSKKVIINNLREYSSDQLAEAIRNGVVSMYELSKSGNLTPLMRRRIESKLAETSTREINMFVKNSSNVSQLEVIDDVPKNMVVEPQQIENSVVSISDIDIPTAKLDEIIMPVADADKGKVTIQSTVEKSDDVLNNKGIFKRPFSFKGRIRRTEYGISFMAYYVWYFIISISMNESELSAEMSIFALITFIPMIWFLLAQSCKRCHDRGNSGWYQIIPFYVLWLLFGDGEKGDNKYGNNPKE